MGQLLCWTVMLPSFIPVLTAVLSWTIGVRQLFKTGKTSIRGAEEIKMGRKEIAVVFSRKFHLFKLLQHLPLYNIMAVKPSKLKWHSFHLCHLTDWEVHDRNRIVNAWLAAVDVTSLRGRWRRVEWAYYSDSWLAAQEAVATSLLGLTSDNMSHWTGLLTCACGVGDL